ncbi:hypothetical protein [Shewanella colwelliana]|uniref:hypothetical protein n=1 Tax=Shewanella colwelliana TaxID=23 RepID=UPI0022AEC65F|nr:hypothetical protein [Shewanella colwelliana]MCZ4337416.1 hypothetical protein [Shewanella colwelliana]
MKTIITATVILAASLFPTAASAQTNPEMEKMTITYRAPLDYALYQYTIELLGHYRSEIQSSIYHQAKHNSHTMAKAFNRSQTQKMTEIAVMPTEKSLSPE